MKGHSICNGIVMRNNPKNWQVKELGKCLFLVKKQFNPSKDINLKYIGLEHIEQQSLRLNGIGSSVEMESNKYCFKKGQILFGKLRPYFRKLYHPKFDGVCSTDIWVIDIKDGNNASFFFYFLADKRIISEANNSSEGTRMPRAKWDYLEKLKYPIPPLYEQQAIAKILSDLDLKIELNQQMNATLEAIGQALFKHWFVDFEFPDEQGNPYKSSGGEMVDSELGEIPKGWNVKQIQDIGRIVCGKTPSTKEKENYGIDFPFITIPDMHDQIFVVKSDRKLSSVGANTQINKILPPFTICVSCIATPGLISITTESSFTNQQINSIICYDANSPFFIYLTMKLKSEQIKAMGLGGTATLNLNTGEFSRIALIVPPNPLMKEFHNIIEAVFQKILINSNEMIILSLMRDSLLPRLMSGKIRVRMESESDS